MYFFTKDVVVLPTILDEESVADPIREVVVVQNSALYILDWVTLLSIVISSTVFLHVINRDTSSAPKVVLQVKETLHLMLKPFFLKQFHMMHQVLHSVSN